MEFYSYYPCYDTWDIYIPDLDIDVKEFKLKILGALEEKVKLSCKYVTKVIKSLYKAVTDGRGIRYPIT